MMMGLGYRSRDWDLIPLPTDIPWIPFRIELEERARAEEFGPKVEYDNLFASFKMRSTDSNTDEKWQCIIWVYNWGSSVIVDVRTSWPGTSAAHACKEYTRKMAVLVERLVRNYKSWEHRGRTRSG